MPRGSHRAAPPPCARRSWSVSVSAALAAPEPPESGSGHAWEPMVRATGSQASPAAFTGSPRPRPHRPADERRRASASMVAASRSTTPVMRKLRYALVPSSPRPFSMMAMTRPPRMASRALPRPPNRLVPPMTAAPTAYRRVAAARVDGDRVEPGRGHDAAHRRQPGPDHEHGDPDAGDVDAGPARGLGVAADGVDVPPVGGAAEHERAGDQQDADHQDAPGDAAERDQRAGRAVLAEHVGADQQCGGDDGGLGEHERSGLGAGRGRAGGASAAPASRCSRRSRRRRAPSRARSACSWWRSRR